MSDLHLDSLEIKNFRCFEHLVIEKLGRVNLIVGKNSVGKTALLEAIWLLASGASWPIIHKILYDRNDLVIYNLPDSSAKYSQQDAIKSLFSGRQKHTPQPLFIFSGNFSLSVQLPAEEDFIEVWAKHPEVEWHVERAWPALPQQEFLEYDVIEQSKKTKTVFIPVKGLTWQATSTYWDDIALTNKEEAIIESLQLLDPKTTRFTFKGENMKDRVRYSVVKTGLFPDPLSLANLGEGIQRVFSIALAMSTASNGFLLVDEIETGLHHRVQAEVWKTLFKLAHEWNLQVFATTHSWDCVKAFQEAVAEDQNEEAMLIRLQKKKSGNGIVPILYDERSLTIATEENIEVR